MGENAKLKCLVNAADPPPVITWTKDGKSLQSNPRIRYKTNLKTVLLKNLAIEDSGNYTCIVANRLGSDNYTFVVTVSKILKSKHPDVSHDHVVKAVTGGNFTLTCETRAKRKRGMPRFQWEKRSQMSEKVVKFKAPIQPVNLLDIKQRLKNRRTQWRFDYNETGTIVGSLTFFNVSKSDHGLYTCRTGNSLSAKIIKIVSVVVVDRSDADKFSKGNKKGSVSDDVKHYGKCCLLTNHRYSIGSYPPPPLYSAYQVINRSRDSSLASVGVYPKRQNTPIDDYAIDIDILCKMHDRNKPLSNA